MDEPLVQLILNYEDDDDDEDEDDIDEGIIYKSYHLSSSSEYILSSHVCAVRDDHSTCIMFRQIQLRSR